MQTVILKNLKITNFKGLKYQNIDFGKVTNIWGDNATGKTSIFDAFTWILFGKDSQDRKDFGIKPLNEAGQTTDKLENEVSAVIEVDGQDILLRRVHRENWVKKRGALTEEFAGNDTLYFVNDVPQKASEYKAKIDSIISEDVFKLITNPLYFNTVLKWEQRRKVLLDIAGDISTDEIITEITTTQNVDRVKELISDLTSEQSIKDARARIAVLKKRIKDELANIPARIDEANRSMPEIPNYAEIEAEIATKQGEIATIDKAVDDLVGANEDALKAIRDKQKEKHDLQMELQVLQDNRKSDHAGTMRNHEAQIRTIETEIERVQGDIDANRSAINKFNNDINRLNEANTVLREQWMAVNAETYEVDASDLTCRACNQPLPEEDMAKTRDILNASFNRKKQESLATIASNGEFNKAEIERLSLIVAKRKNENDTQQQALNELKAQLETAKANPPATVNTEPSKEELELEAQIAGFLIPELPTVDIAELKAKRNALTNEIQDLKTKLSVKDQVNQINNRINQLSTQERELSGQLADQERSEFVIEAFQKAKMGKLQQRINDKFKYARFKLFDTQINGQEVPCCETTMNGVSYSDLNTAGTIQVGVDIINCLVGFYGVTTVCFLDNRESVVKIPETNMQIVNLIVSEADKKLRIETK